VFFFDCCECSGREAEVEEEDKKIEPTLILTGEH